MPTLQLIEVRIPTQHEMMKGSLNGNFSWLFSQSFGLVLLRRPSLIPTSMTHHKDMISIAYQCSLLLFSHWLSPYIDLHIVDVVMFPHGKRTPGGGYYTTTVQLMNPAVKYDCVHHKSLTMVNKLYLNGVEVS